MSPLLFLFIIDGLSRLIYKARLEGKVKGIELTQLIRITHLLFLDDVTLFGEGTLKEWRSYKSILDSFCQAIGILISEKKSTFLENDIVDSFCREVKSLFPF